jgi:hypothetical protein
MQCIQSAQGHPVRGLWVNAKKQRASEVVHSGSLEAEAENGHQYNAIKRALVENQGAL